MLLIEVYRTKVHLRNGYIAYDVDWEWSNNSKLVYQNFVPSNRKPFLRDANASDPTK